jgi:hypothetical protein
VFSCKTLADGSSTFSLAPHLDCDSDEAHVAKSVAAASLAIWGIGFPLFLGGMIHRFGDNPQYSFVIVSFGYKPDLQFWEAWECLKKFGILLIITVLRKTPELAAGSLLLFLCFTMVVSALFEPSVSSLINKGHLASDFLIFLVLLVGLLSSGAGGKLPELATLSVVVVSYAACLLAGLIFIAYIEAGSKLFKGSRAHLIWDNFMETSQDGRNRAAATVKRLSSRLSLGFSATIVPVAEAGHAADRAETVEIPSSAAAGAAASHLPRAFSNEPSQLADLKDKYIISLNKMQAKVLSLAKNSILADVDDGHDLKMQLEKFALKLETLVDNHEQSTNLKLGYTALHRTRVEVLSLAADSMLADLDDETCLQMQPKQCAVNLETLVRDHGLSSSSRRLPNDYVVEDIDALKMRDDIVSLECAADCHP